MDKVITFYNLRKLHFETQTLESFSRINFWGLTNLFNSALVATLIRSMDENVSYLLWYLEVGS